MLIGCGLGHTAQTEKLVAELIENAEIPIVLDADGINSLCPNIDVLLKKKVQLSSPLTLRSLQGFVA